MAYERRVQITKATNDLYKFYKDKYRENALEERLFKKIYYDLNKEVSDLIITKSFEYKLPFRMGYLRIKKAKVKLKLNSEGRVDQARSIPDWKATWDYWYEIYPGKTNKEIRQIKNKKRIYQLNHHTDGDVMSWFWDKKTARVKNKSFYTFRPVKGGCLGEIYFGRLGLGNWIKSDLKDNDYFY